MTVTNKLYKFTTGTDAVADQVNSGNSFILNNQINTFLDGATETNQNNLKLDLFGSDTAQYLEFMEYDSGNDWYECADTSTIYYVIISATSTTATASGNVKIVPLSSGKWMVYATAGTYEVNRAEVFEYLFKPDTLTDATTAIVKTDFTSITAIQTTDSDDVGRRIHYGYVSKSGSVGILTKTGTFANTSTNTAVSVWSYIQEANGIYVRVELPEGTIVNGSTGTIDEYGTDTSAEEQDNPADFQFDFNGNNDHTFSGVAHAIVLTKSTISWATVGTFGTDYEYDFNVDGSIPDFTLESTLSDLTCKITTDSTTITTNETLAIINAIYSLTAGNSIAYEASFNNGTNWLAVTESILSKIINTGTNFRVRMTITRANDNETDSITSYGAYYS